MNTLEFQERPMKERRKTQEILVDIYREENTKKPKIKENEDEILKELFLHDSEDSILIDIYQVKPRKKSVKMKTKTKDTLEIDDIDKFINQNDNIDINVDFQNDKDVKDMEDVEEHKDNEEIKMEMEIVNDKEENQQQEHQMQEVEQEHQMQEQQKEKEEIKTQTKLSAMIMKKRNETNEKRKKRERMEEQKRLEIQQKMDEERMMRSSGMGMEIARGIFIGNENTCENHQLLKENNIKGIVNCSKNIPCYFNNTHTPDYQGENIDYLRIAIDDDNKINIKPFFEESYQFIDSIRQKQGNVLVHCKLGKSRSATIVVSYLMKKYRIGVVACEELFKRRNWSININTDFYPVLFEYEDDLMIAFDELNGNPTVPRRRTRRSSGITAFQSNKVKSIISEFDQL